jgi:tetratricopeptide (TPR) repeat protein
LQKEIEDLARAGLSNYEALSAATVNPGDWIGEHLHEEHPPGVIAPGRRADMLILDANPLEDLAALEGVVHIVARGRWFDRITLLQVADQRAEEYRGALLPYERFKQLTVAGELDAAEALLSDDDTGLLGENAVNALGYYHLYRLEDPDTAIAMFEINTRVYADSFNVWDSLGEGYMVAGDSERAIVSYERSLQLNPDNGNAKQMIERIRGGGSVGGR